MGSELGCECVFGARGLKNRTFFYRRAAATLPSENPASRPLFLRYTGESHWKSDRREPRRTGSLRLSEQCWRRGFLADDPSEQVSRLLGDSGVQGREREELLDLVYRELRVIAQKRMALERPGHTLQATALVNEAFLRLVNDRSVAWEKKRTFYIAASEAMRRILIDHARRRGRARRGGGRPNVSISAIDLAVEQDPQEILALDEAVGRLEAEDSRAAEVVQLRFFAGLSVGETARVLGTSERSVLREWSFARARLFQLLRPDEP